MGNEQPGRRAQLIELVARAEAMIEALEARYPTSRWALTAFSRFRVCELLGVPPYDQSKSDVDADPAQLLEEAARLADRLEVPVVELSWRLAVADALRCAAADVRMVRDAGNV